MYIRRTESKYKDKTYVNYQLVESHSTPKGPRQKVICSLGDLSPRPKKAWLELANKVVRALQDTPDLIDSVEKPDEEVTAIVEKVRNAELRRRRVEQAVVPVADATVEVPESIAVLPDKVRIEEPRAAGHVHVGHQFWQRLDLDKILADAGLRPRARKLACAMVMNRLILPKAEHAMPEWFQSVALGDLLKSDFSEISDDSLYQMLDKLHPNRAMIETALCERERELFNLDQTVYLYDLTSHYFEGQANANPKAKRGYSRDHRPDCKQVVLGLVINRDGFPKAHEVFDGNTQDRASLDKMLDILDKRVGLKPGQMVVVDRGMAHPENLEQITKRGLHYLVATRQAERDEYLAELEDDSEFAEIIREPSPTNPMQKKSRVRVKKCKSENGMIVMCLSDGRVEKNRAIRGKQEGRLEADLKKLRKFVETAKKLNPVKVGERIGRIKERYPRVARYWSIGFDAETKVLTTEKDEFKRAKAEKLDGAWLLKTDRTDLTPDEAWRTYVLLTRAETAFRDMKTPLAERPIHHQREDRVETHIFLCLLAYHILISVEHTLRQQQDHRSWATVRETLSSHVIATVALPTADGAELHIRKASTPEPDQAALYKLLRVPTEIVKPTRTWCESALPIARI